MAQQLINSGASTDLTRKLRYLRRIVVRESAGTPALFKLLLKDGGTGGTLILAVEGAASGMVDLKFDPPLKFASGLYVGTSAGTWDGLVEGY